MEIRKYIYYEKPGRIIMYRLRGIRKLITVKIEIGTIDYEKSFKELFPIAMKKLEMIENKNLVLRFLVKMGEESMTAVLGILEKLDDWSKGEILCCIIRLYGEEIVAKLNEMLAKDAIGKNMEINRIFLVQKEEHMELYAYGAKVDYRGLLDNPDIERKVKDAAENMAQGFGKTFQEVAGNNAGTLAKIAARMMPGKVEDIGLNLLQKEKNKQKLLSLSEKALQDKGVWLDLIDFQFEQMDFQNEDLDFIWSDDRKVQLFSKELEEKILDAVVEYIKPLL